MEFTITPEEQKILLYEARESIAAILEKREPVYQAAGDSARDLRCGAFVTLHKDGELRGCIGRMMGTEALETTVRVMAREAAFGDPRFPPLTAGELPRCVIEISVLSPMVICEDPRSVRVGVHGLYLSCQGRSGVLLPQVPVEQHWDLDDYLAYICVKAGLPDGAYNNPAAKLYTFTAVVFSE
jgi:AmmeMemoRadiSam system protein A